MSTTQSQNFGIQELIQQLRKTTPRDDHAIRIIAVRSPVSSASKIRSSLLAKGTDISRRTVSRRLVDDFDLKAHKPAHKPRLTQAMKSKRLAFAKKHVKWTIQQWQQVLFFDESTVQQFTNRKRYVRRPSGKRFSERYTIQTMKHPPPSVMIWGNVNKWNGWTLFSATWNDHEWSKILRFIKKQVGIAYGHS